MNQYFEKLNPIVKEYFNILSPDGIPEFICEYIDTDEMKRIGKIGTACGTNYTNIYNHKFWYTNLDHSIGVALIVWNFTKDKKQTLAGLFHDIATPTFKHCIDFMNGDHEKQESTEMLTSDIIKNSKEIMNLLKRDNIKLEEVEDYHKYPIADNDTPQLSADRLEYTFSNGLYFDSFDILNLDLIKEIYNDIEILIDESNEKELGFRNVEVAEKFVDKASKLWPCWRETRNSLVMQFLADVVRKSFELGEITKKDLYTLSEKEVIEKIVNSKDKNISNSFRKFRETDKVYASDEFVYNKYCIEIKNKVRYIIPLVRNMDDNIRINKISSKTNDIITNYLNYKPKKYGYLEFEL